MTAKRLRAATIEELLEIYENEPYQVWRWTSAPNDVWLEFLNARPETREYVAANKTIGASVIQHLADDDEYRVRGKIAKKRATPEDVMLQLARDPDDRIRSSIACNPKATERVLEALIDDHWYAVRERARQRLAELGKAEATKVSKRSEWEFVLRAENEESLDEQQNWIGSTLWSNLVDQRRDSANEELFVCRWEVNESWDDFGIGMHEIIKKAGRISDRWKISAPQVSRNITSFEGSLDRPNPQTRIHKDAQIDIERASFRLIEEVVE